MLAACDQVDCKTAVSWLMSIASADLRHKENLDASVAALQARQALVILLRSQRPIAEPLITEQYFALSAVQQAEQPYNEKTAPDAQTVACSSALWESSADRLIA